MTLATQADRRAYWMLVGDIDDEITALRSRIQHAEQRIETLERRRELISREALTTPEEAS